MSRGRDWTLLGGQDPTPGSVGTVATTAASYRSAGDGAVDCGMGLQDIGLAAGATWSGNSAAAFSGALEVLPAPLTAHDAAAAVVAQALAAWAEALPSYQDRADDLLAQAEATKAALDAAIGARPGYVARQSAAISQLTQAQRIPDPQARADAVAAASREVHRRAEQLAVHDGAIAGLEDDLAGHRAAAAALASEHLDHATSVAGIITGATLDPLSLPPLSARVAANVFGALGVDPLAGGEWSPREIAEMVALAQATDIDPDGWAAEIADFFLGDVGNFWTGGDDDGVPVGQLGAAALRAFRMRAWFRDGTLPVFNTGFVGDRIARLLGRFPALAPAGSWLSSPAATSVFRRVGVAGGLFGTATGLVDLYQQGNPIDAFQAEGAGYVADVAGTAFSASSTAFFIAPNPVTGALVIGTGVVYVGAEIVDHWDDITEWTDNAWDATTEWASTTWDNGTQALTDAVVSNVMAIDEAWDAGTEFVADVGSSLADGACDLVAGAGDLLGSAGDLVGGWF